jgi:hypothetical protein
MVGYYLSILVHTILFLFTTLYVFFRKSNIYDLLYFTTISSIIMSWILFGECLLSYVEKKLLDPTYRFNNNKYEHPLMKQMFSPTFEIWFKHIAVILYLYNLYIMMTIYKVPIPITFVIYISLIKEMLPNLYINT